MNIRILAYTTALFVATISTQSHAQTAATAPTQTIGKYAVTLRVPASGVFAEESVDIEFRLADNSNNDPILGAAGVVRAVTRASITMPLMAGMPAQTPKIHSEGVPGDYGIECYFPHGGIYRIDLDITPPTEKSAIKMHFDVDVKDAVAGKKPRPQPFYLDLERPSRIDANTPAPLKLTVRESSSKKIVTKFDVAHTKLLHMIIVSKDLGWFAHEHPDAQPDGTFTIAQTFPAGGNYRVFADVAPSGAGSQVLSTPVTVSGSTGKWDNSMIPTTGPISSGGITAKLSANSAKLPIGVSDTLRYSITDTAAGSAVLDLEPYLGAMGHLILIHQDGGTFVHSHPLEDDVALAKSKMGDVGFTVRIPRAGLYKGWAQFQRAGVVITLPFVLNVKKTSEAAK